MSASGRSSFGPPRRFRRRRECVATRGLPGVHIDKRKGSARCRRRRSGWALRGRQRRSRGIRPTTPSPPGWCARHHPFRVDVRTRFRRAWTPTGVNSFVALAGWYLDAVRRAAPPTCCSATPPAARSTAWRPARCASATSPRCTTQPSTSCGWAWPRSTRRRSLRLRRLVDGPRCIRPGRRRRGHRADGTRPGQAAGRVRPPAPGP